MRSTSDLDRGTAVANGTRKHTHCGHFQDTTCPICNISPARSTAVALLLLLPTAITALAHPELVRSDGITPTTCATYATGGGVHDLKLLTSVTCENLYVAMYSVTAYSAEIPLVSKLRPTFVRPTAQKSLLARGVVGASAGK